MTTTTLLPTYNTPSFSYSTTVDNVQVELSFNWNTKTTHYHLTVTTQDGAILVDGFKLIEGFPIQTSAMYERGLKGVFLMTKFNSEIQDNETTRQSINENFNFCYAT